MKFIFLTYDGVGLSVAHKLLLEGNEVVIAQIKDLKVATKETEEERQKRLKLYDGILNKEDADKVLEWAKNIENKDEWFVIADFNNLFEYADKFRELGFKGLLPTKEDWEFEQDKIKAKEFVLQNYNIFSTQEVVEFSKIENALKFLEDTNKIYGVRGFHELAPVYFPISNYKEVAIEELRNVLTINKEYYEAEGFVLEEKIEDAIEFTPEIIVFDGVPLGMSVCLEVREIGAGNMGRQMEDNASFIVWIEKDSNAWKKLYKWFFCPALDRIIRPNEAVVWSCGVLYSPSRDKFYFSKFYSNKERYNAWFDKLATFPRITDYFERISNKMPVYQEDTKPFGASIRVFNGLANSPKKKDLTSTDSLIITDINEKNVWMQDVYKKDDKLYTTDYNAELGTITQAGEDWKKLFVAIDNLLNNGRYFVFPSMLYRRYFDLLFNGYLNNLPDRYLFLYNLIEYMPITKKTLTDEDLVQKVEELIVNKKGLDQKSEEQLLDDIKKLIDELNAT